MKNYTIYRSSRKDYAECDIFENGEVIHKAYIKKGTTSPAFIDSAKIHLQSEYDVEQTLIPGVTKRIVKYLHQDIKFAEIQWNSDETYTLRFPDDAFQIMRLDGETFAFRKGEKTVAMISRYKGDRVSIQSDYSYEPIYSVECEEDISTQCLIIVFGFPILYFGF